MYIKYMNIFVRARQLIENTPPVMKGIISFCFAKYAKLRFTMYNDVSLTYHVKLS